MDKKKSLYCISALYSTAKAAVILAIYHLSCFLVVYMINKAMIKKRYPIHNRINIYVFDIFHMHDLN